VQVCGDDFFFKKSLLLHFFSPRKEKQWGSFNNVVARLQHLEVRKNAGNCKLFSRLTLRQLQRLLLPRRDQGEDIAAI
jgi:hypothetical protein